MWRVTCLLILLGMRVSVERCPSMSIRRCRCTGRRRRSRPVARRRGPRGAFHGGWRRCVADDTVHALIVCFAPRSRLTVIDVHRVHIGLFVRVALVVRVALAHARVGRGGRHERMVLQTVETGVVGVVGATAADVWVWETGGCTSGMIPPMPAHIGIDVEFPSTPRKWTTICCGKYYQHGEKHGRGQEGNSGGW